MAANLLDRRKTQSFPDVLEKLLLYFHVECQSGWVGDRGSSSLKISR